MESKSLKQLYYDYDLRMWCRIVGRQVSGFGQKVRFASHTYAIFPCDTFEYRLSFCVVSFITFYDLEYCIVALRIIEIRVLRKTIWPQCEEVKRD